jgi:DNA replication protein DnaC
MLSEPTMEKLTAMKLHGMARAFRQWLDQPKGKDLAPADLVGMLADAEWLDRESRRLTTRLRQARFRLSASVEDIDYSHARGLSKPVMVELAGCRWVANHQNVLVTGETGLGKSYLACALGQKACREGFSVAYRRASRLFDELAQARADGSHPLLLRRFAKTQLLILDDFGLEVLAAPQRRDLLEVLEDRYGISSTIVTSQLDTEHWHAVIGDETIADAVCDRLVHNAHRIRLKGGESLRKARPKERPSANPQ